MRLSCHSTWRLNQRSLVRAPDRAKQERIVLGARGSVTEPDILSVLSASYLRGIKGNIALDPGDRPSNLTSPQAPALAHSPHK